jgi:hypothetical protein
VTVPRPLVVITTSRWMVARVGGDDGMAYEVDQNCYPIALAVPRCLQLRRQYPDQVYAIVDRRSQYADKQSTLPPGPRQYAGVDEGPGGGPSI